MAAAVTASSSNVGIPRLSHRRHPGDTGGMPTRHQIAVAAVALAALVLGSVAYAAGSIDRPATAGRPAGRDVSFAPAATCDLVTVAALAARHPLVGQFVVVQSPDAAATTGTLEVAARDGSGAWRCQRASQPARLGRSGTRPLLERVSGDGSTPAGVFPLGVVTAWDGRRFSMFGNQPDPGVLAPYRAVQRQDCWGATRHTARYQHLVDLPDCPGPDDEWLPRFGDVYAHAAVIGANLDPISGDAPGETPYAAAIFLHRHAYTIAGSASGVTKPTSGCVSLAYDDLVATLRSIDPRLSPHFAIGPTDWLRSTA
jgi:L,D-peptidoglycan transpeptidase YkuD (ErfK/YbiS/YcfS/YnhG family)